MGECLGRDVYIIKIEKEVWVSQVYLGASSALAVCSPSRLELSDSHRSTTQRLLLRQIGEVELGRRSDVDSNRKIQDFLIDASSPKPLLSGNLNGALLPSLRPSLRRQA